MTRRALWLLAFFAVVHGLVSFPNHAGFRTYALDLGLYTHAMWHYAHGAIHDSLLFLEHPQPILADHFDLYLPLLSPLIHLFGTWTLLVVQWLSVLMGAWGTRLFLLRLGLPEPSALLGMTMHLLFFGLFGAMAFDYHSNVVSAMMLPWFLIAVFSDRIAAACLIFLVMLMGKETMGFWLGPLALLVAMNEPLTRRMRATTAILGLFGIIWSVAVIGWIMPALSTDGNYAHFDYSLLGRTAADVPAALVGRPLELIKALFIDHRGVENGTAMKLEFWIMTVVAGGWALILLPRWGLMALPLLAQKMWHDDPGKWTVIAHYGVELAPLVGMAVPLALAGSSNARVRRSLSWLALGLSLACTIRFMDRTIAYHDRSRIRIYQAQHYVKDYDTGAVREALRSIPPGATVSAQSPAVPQLALRPRIYQYPIIRDADFIVLLPKESPYPLSADTYRMRLERYRADTVWMNIAETDGIVIFQRRGTGP